MIRRPGSVLVLTLVMGIPGCGSRGEEDGGSGASSREVAPPPPPEAWAPFVGEYAAETDTLSILEDLQAPYVLFWNGGGQALRQMDDTLFQMEGNGGTVAVHRAEDGHVAGLQLDGRGYLRLALGGEEGSTFQISPLRPPEELRSEALAASPPREEADFLAPDLVDLTSLDPTMHLDIRYASTNNFMDEAMYSSARAFLQRPAAEALVRVSRRLRDEGYGLLIHDAYRPWYVTKMFWDATPEDLRDFVADPASGSRHNRGCAVDLTLYDLNTGDPVEMPSGYDEFSPRAHADYPGGTSRQRWYRRLLRQAMEEEGFEVYAGEWWHFDFQDWSRYPLGNQVFSEIGSPDSGR